MGAVFVGAAAEGAALPCVLLLERPGHHEWHSLSAGLPVQVRAMLASPHFSLPPNLCVL